jgi:hypothetical protein
VKTVATAQAVGRRQWWSEDGDFDGAFRLLHDNYVRDGHVTSHPTSRRVGIFNALPSTWVFVAREGDPGFAHRPPHGSGWSTPDACR